MAWELQIHTFDVGQGESALIVARDPAQAPVPYKTMLIDGGIASQGSLVYTFINNTLPAGIPIDHIVITHYDVDHSGGIISLLGADNLFDIVDTVAKVGLAEAMMANNRAQQIAAGTAGICSALMGAYALGGGPDYTAQARQAGFSARGQVGPTAPDALAQEWGLEEAEQLVGTQALNPWLIPQRSTKKRRDIAKLTGIQIADILANPAITGAGLEATRSAVRQFVFNQIRTLFANDNCHFPTNGRFRNTHIIDTGNDNMPESYATYAAGEILLASTGIRAPTVNRQRSTQALGREILWSSGPNAAVPGPTLPLVFVVALNKRMWKGNRQKMPIGQSIDNNSDSYGLMVRFNGFFFYTGGDLPTAGEDLIAQAIMTNGLPVPANPVVDPPAATFPVPHRIAAFKCGHHGANTCTSTHFLNGSTVDQIAYPGLQPRAAIISCGHPGVFYDHPGQDLVNRLQGSPTLQNFFLTGFQVSTHTGPKTHIPASQNPVVSQYPGLPTNRARVGGDSNNHYGNIILTISLAESISTSLPTDPVPRQFHITYWEADALPVAAPVTVTIPF